VEHGTNVEEIRNVYKIIVEKLRVWFRNLRVDDRILLKWMLQRRVMKLWPILKWLIVGLRAWPLWGFSVIGNLLTSWTTISCSRSTVEIPHYLFN